MENKHRRGESADIPFRSGRFFCANGHWYFSTREGAEQGPFPSHPAAEAALLNFVRDRSFVHTPTGKAAELRHEDTDDRPGSGHRFYW